MSLVRRYVLGLFGDALKAFLAFYFIARFRDDWIKSISVEAQKRGVTEQRY